MLILKKLCPQNDFYDCSQKNVLCFEMLTLSELWPKDDFFIKPYFARNVDFSQIYVKNNVDIKRVMSTKRFL